MTGLMWYLRLLKFKVTAYVIITVGTAIMWLDGVRKFNSKRRQNVRQDERDVTGKVVIVTGSNSGIGKQTAKELAARGATVIMACRDSKRAEDARQDILREVPTAKLVIMFVDMSDLDSIRRFAQEFKERYDHLDVLINNAGIFSWEQTITKHGFESHMGINYLGSFLLTLLLIEPLMKAEHARIVFLSSSTTLLSSLHLSNLMSRNQLRVPWTLYANSKLALAIFSNELSKLLGGTNVKTYALCTGMVYTNLLDRTQPLIKRLLNWFVLPLVTYPVEEGTENVLHCVLSKSLQEESGRFYRYLNIWEDPEKLMAKYSGAKLWELSEELVGLKGFKENFRVSTSARSIA